MHGLPRRRRGGADQPQHQAADPLLPRGRGRDPRAAARAVRARRRAVRRASGDRLEFEVLQERIHPAKSRVDMLAEKTPACFVAFDLLALGDTSYVDRPFSERRAAMEEALAGLTGPCYLTRTTTDTERGGGVVPPVRGRRPGRRGRQAADRDLPAERPHHAEDQARAHRRRGRRRLPRAQDVDARAAAAGQPPARPVRRRQAAAHRRLGQLHREASGRADRGAAAAGRARSRSTPGASGRSGRSPTRTGCRAPRAGGAPGKDLSFTPLRPDLVLEVAYDHMEGRRFRHTAQFRRWRTDRDPESCGYEQLEEPVSYELDRILSAGHEAGAGGDHHG